MRLVDQILNDLHASSGVRFISIVSTSGQPITCSPADAQSDMLSLASLAASSFAATQQLAAVLNEREFTLLFHEGRNSNLHVAQVTDRVLLVVAFGRDTQVGKVRLYTARAIEALGPLFRAAEEDIDLAVVDKQYTVEASEAVDDLFGGVD
ncbi:MAG: hypothetical protein GXX83_01785 [Gaiellales bacterium]|nr:hypothetical protein [Gaiellales bacterium]